MTKMREKLDKGKQGEDYALKFLQEKGFRLLTRNFNARNSEIDLIMQKDDLLVFVEVRMKANANYGYPEDTMSKTKMNAIKRGAEEYMLKNPWDGKARFDMISIIEFPEFQIEHFEDAFF